MNPLSSLLTPAVVRVAACASPPTPTPASVQPATAPPRVAPPDSTAAVRDRMAKEVLATISGRETEPAGQVFKNIKSLNAIPARRLVAIMNRGYGRSLG